MTANRSVDAADTDYESWKAAFERLSPLQRAVLAKEAEATARELVEEGVLEEVDVDGKKVYEVTEKGRALLVALVKRAGGSI